MRRPCRRGMISGLPDTLPTQNLELHPYHERISYSNDYKIYLLNRRVESLNHHFMLQNDIRNNFEISSTTKTSNFQTNNFTQLHKQTHVIFWLNCLIFWSCICNFSPFSCNLTIILHSLKPKIKFCIVLLLFYPSYWQ